MKKDKKNTLVKAFTIFLIVVFLVWTFATWLMVVFSGNSSTPIKTESK